jgi:predicted S18 family serine protease
VDDLSEKYEIEIKEISTLDEAIFEFTGKRFREKKTNLTISQDYKDIMKMLAIQLCSRSTKLRNRISDFEIRDNKTKPILDNAINLSAKGKSSFSEGMYYSSASYCFGANVEFDYLSLLQANLTEEDVMEEVDELRREIENFDEIIENEKIMTITDLESYMIVKERLIEASDFADFVAESIENNYTNLHNLAYAKGRLNSARSWSKFLENKGKKFNFNDEVIRNACRTKLSEVEERLQYVQLYLPQNLENTGKELAYAYQDLEEGNYELCLFKASKAKANVDAVLSVFGVRNNNVNNIINQKLDVVERNLVEETEKGVFPILGYSYFEYANSLKDSDPYSALLYSEYALELSNLDIYFKSSGSNGVTLFEKIDKKLFIILIIGIILGFFVARIVGYKKKKSKRRK